MNKSEWIEEFKKINGRDPRPSEFRAALNRQEFSLDADESGQSSPAVPSANTKRLTRKEKRLLKKTSRGLNRRNGINALILSMLSLLFTLSPILIVLNPSVILNAGGSATDNTGSFVAALFFFGVLLLLLSLVFGFMSLIERPRQLALTALIFSFINAFYVYTVVNFTQFSAADFQKAVSIFQNIFR